MFNLVPYAGMALNYANVDKGSSTSSGAGSITFSFTGKQFGKEDADRHLLCLSAFGGSSAQPSSCTIGGVSATLVAGDTGVRRSQIWRAHVPTGTSGNVVISGTSGANGCGFLLYSIYPLRNTSAVSTLTSSGNLTIPSGGVGIGAAMDSVVSGNPLSIVWTGLIGDDYVLWTSGNDFRLSAAILGNVSGVFAVNAVGSSAGDYGLACASFEV